MLVPRKARRARLLGGWALATAAWAGAWSCSGSISGPRGDAGADAAARTDATIDQGGWTDAARRDAVDAPAARDGGRDAPERDGHDANVADARDGGADVPRSDGGPTCLAPTDHTYHVEPTASGVAETGSRDCPYRRISSALVAIAAAQETSSVPVTISIDGNLDPISQGPDEFPIAVPAGVDITGGVTPAPLVTVPAGAGGFTYSYPGPTTAPGKDGGHLSNLSLVEAGGPAGHAAGVTVQNTYLGPLGTNQSAFGIQISGLEVRGFDRGVDVETNGNVFIVDGTTAEANNDGLYVASGFVTVTPGAAGPVHFDNNLAFGVYVDGASAVFFQGVHTAAGGRSITANDNAAGGVRLSSSNNLWQYLFTLEMRGNPTGARLYLEQPVSIIDSIIADNGVGIELLPYAAASLANAGWTNLGSDTGTTENEFSGNAPDLCVAGAYVSGLSIYAANNLWGGGRDCLHATSAQTLTVDQTGCATATNLGFANSSSGFTDTNLVVSGCSW
jgi:hypothetical protein